MSTTALKKTLLPIHIWAIAVGLVISGDYFGWNYGWAAAGTVGFLWATIIVTILYICFIFSFTELTTAIPDAGGPFAYASKTLGVFGGLIAGYATLVEFLLAAPAIGFALGSYVHFLIPSVGVLPVAIFCYFLFTGINLLGIKESAIFTLLITILAIAELLLFMGIIAPSFKIDNFLQNPMPFGIKGIFAALPFAIWFYLAIEGVAMVAEEVKDPQRNISKGYIWGIFTLVILAFGVMILTGGITNWQVLSKIDYPLPEAVSIVLGKENSFTKLFASIGLLGLVASFHGIIIGYSRQIFALARAGFLPKQLALIHPKRKTPHWALLIGGVVGIICLCTATTDKLIILSVLGAIILYIISMISLFKLRKQKGYKPVYTTPFYPLFPIIALVLSVVCLIAIVYYNLYLSILFLIGFIAVCIVYYGVKYANKKIEK